MENSSEGMRKNAENCGELAERATTDHEKAVQTDGKGVGQFGR
jgi:hypothetical protein